LTARRRIVVDAHCDTLLRMVERDERLDSAGGHLDLPRLLASPVALQWFAVYVEPGLGEDRGLRRALQMIGRFWQEMEAHADRLRPVRTVEDLEALDDEHVGALLTLEGGDILGDTPELLDLLFRLGVRALMLTWNGRNRLADGAGDATSGGGLSALGREVVARAQALGVLLDVSHLADAAFWDLLGRTQGPVVASHSNARAVTAHPRNLSDDMIRAIAQRGGVIGINFHAGFLTAEGPASLDDLFRHMDHLLAVGGEDAVGFGSDYDGIPQAPVGLPDVAAFGELLEAMARRGFPTRVIEKVAGENFRRVLRATLPKEDVRFAL
jgi:membrane dipeptidase